MSDETDLTVWRGVEAAAVLLVLGFFLYATRTILNPLLLLFLLWAVLLPFRGKEGHSALLVTASVLAMIWLYVEQQPPEKISNHAWYTFWYVLPTSDDTDQHAWT